MLCKVTAQPGYNQRCNWIKLFQFFHNSYVGNIIQGLLEVKIHSILIQFLSQSCAVKVDFPFWNPHCASEIGWCSVGWSVINKWKHYQGVLLGIKRSLRDIGLYPDGLFLAVDLGISTTLWSSCLPKTYSSTCLQIFNHPPMIFLFKNTIMMICTNTSTSILLAVVRTSFMLAQSTVGSNFQNF